jgi:IS605 OrfB family transposase
MINQARTFQARIDGHPALDATAALLSRAERCLWAEMAKGRKPNDCKSEFLRRFGITARQFNALAVAAKGKASSLKEIGKLRLRELDARIKVTLKTIRKLEKRKASAAKLHQKKRRLGILRDRQTAIRAEIKRPAPALCFGSAKLFNAQHHLEENGFSDHAEWQGVWRERRASQFFCLGSKDEASGNQTCTATLTADGVVMLRLRLPDAVWRELGSKKYIELGPVRFGYGHDVVTAAIQAHATDQGEALSWRFVRDAKGWRVFVSLFQELPDAAPDFARGCLAVDMNAGFLAAAFLDAHGNPKGRFTVPMLTQHRRTDQVEASIGNAAARLVALAKRRGVPIVIEDLDFEAKKTRLREEARPRMARMLSAFAFNGFRTMLERRAAREGVAVLAVDPAYTSFQGRARFMVRYGLSVHHAAAVVIGRRAMNYSERLPLSLALPAGDIPATRKRNQSRVTLARPARIGRRHVRDQWARAMGAWKAALKGLRPTGRRKAAGPSQARTAQAAPAWDRSLEEDAAFLANPTFPPRTHDGAIPSREPSTKLLGGRPCATLLRDEQRCAGF